MRLPNPSRLLSDKVLRTMAFMTLGPDLLSQRNPSHSGRQRYYMRNFCERQMLLDSTG